MKFQLQFVKDLIENQFLWEEPTENQFLDARWDKQIADTGNPSPYYRLFYHLAKTLKPKVSVELGGWQGTCAAHIAGGNPDGIVITIDHHSDPGDDFHKAKMIEATQSFRNIVYFQGWTWDVLEQVKQYAPIDFLFIDSWHHYDKAMRDWNDYSPLLSNEALVVCDDLIEGTHHEQPIYGMLSFWKEMKGEKFLSGNPHPGFPMGFLKYKRG